MSARLAHPLALNHTRLWHAQALRHGAAVKRCLEMDLLILIRSESVERRQLRLPA